MRPNNTRIVLVETSHPGNVGSTARAMKTMGFTELYLVNPNLSPYETAKSMAAGADDILENAHITASLDEALKGCHMIFATSSRPRDLSLPGFSSKEFAHFIKTKNA